MAKSKFVGDQEEGEAVRLSLFPVANPPENNEDEGEDEDEDDQ